MDKRAVNVYQLPDVCICCGEPVPEGRLVCAACEHSDFFPTVERNVKKRRNASSSKKEKRVDFEKKHEM